MVVTVMPDVSSGEVDMLLNDREADRPLCPAVALAGKDGVTTMAAVAFAEGIAITNVNTVAQTATIPVTSRRTGFGSVRAINALPECPAPGMLARR
jgi:hypothetical protein